MYETPNHCTRTTKTNLYRIPGEQGDGTGSRHKDTNTIRISFDCFYTYLHAVHRTDWILAAWVATTACTALLCARPRRNIDGHSLRMRKEWTHPEWNHMHCGLFLATSWTSLGGTQTQAMAMEEEHAVLELL